MIFVFAQYVSGALPNFVDASLSVKETQDPIHALYFESILILLIVLYKRI